MRGDIGIKPFEFRTSWNDYAKGYPSLAGFIASDPDKTTSIYRRFDRLAARNLLYLQSELVELEAQQDELDAQDFSHVTTTSEKESARNWKTMKDRAGQEGYPREKERLRLAKEIREKIKEYSMQAIVEFATMLEAEIWKEKLLSTKVSFSLSDNPRQGRLRPSETFSTMSIKAGTKATQPWAAAAPEFWTIQVISWHLAKVKRKTN